MGDESTVIEIELPEVREGDMPNNQETVGKGRSNACISTTLKRLWILGVAFLIIMGVVCLIFYTDGYFVSEEVDTGGNQSNGTGENITNAQSPGKEAIYFSVAINYPPTAFIVSIVTSFLISLVVAIFERACCIALLSLTGLAFYLGRLILFIHIIKLLYAGPITNSWNNAKMILGMIPCQIGMISQEIMAMQSASGGAYNKEFEDAVKRMTTLNIETIKKIIDVPKQTLEMFSSALEHVILDISSVNANITVNNVTLSTHDVLDYENDVDTIRHIEHPSVKGTDSLFTIGTKVNALFVDTTNFIQQLLSYMLWIVVFAITICMLIQACYFLYRYLRYHDDNIYFTSEEFKKLDGEKTGSKLLPLRERERSRLIDLKSWRQWCPSCSELLVILWEVLHLFIPTFLAMVVLFCVFDGLLYHTMQVLQREANVSVVIGGGSGFEVVFNHTSPGIRQLYHLFPSNSTSFNYSFEVNTEGCLPIPLPPFYQDSTKLGCLIGMCIGIVFLTFLNPYAYGRKIQHKIAAMFYPEREQKRISYLYHCLLKLREMCDGNDKPVLHWFADRSPWFKRVLKIFLKKDI